MTRDVPSEVDVKADDPDVARLLDDVVGGHRLTEAEAARLFRHAPLAALGAAAHELREHRTDPAVVTYVVDRNINYTNVCNVYCTFCAFYRTPKDHDTYVLPVEDVVKKVDELVSLGGTQVLLQGGLNPELPLTYLEDVFRAIHEKHPDVDIHSLTATEIEFYAKEEGVTHRALIDRLKESGWKSLPGGGMEILVDRVRDKVSPLKTKADVYLDIHRDVHEAGCTSTATMMFGMVETVAERVEHLRMVRDLQDDTGGFTAFIPWTFQTDGLATPLRRQPATADEYLRVIAISRLFLDNVDHIQSGWVTEGPKVAQAALAMGADDWGGILMEENVISAAGTLFSMSPADARRFIRDCGYVPAQRDTYYNIVKRFDEEPEDEVLPERLTLAVGQRATLPSGGARVPVTLRRPGDGA